MTTFGKAIGELIRTKRNVAGFSQLELALQAYEDETKVRRIVDIEKGYVARPQMKTLLPLIETLSITQPQIAACHKYPTLSISDREKLGLTETLVENLAEQFGIEFPNRDYQQLMSFLTDKAMEWRQLVDRFQLLIDQDEKLNEELERAKAAIDQAKFDGADSILSKCEESVRRDRVMVEVGRLSDIRALRGSAKLLSGDIEVAFNHFYRAAEFFSSVERNQQAARLMQYQDQLHWHGRRFGKKALKYSINLSLKAKEILNDVGTDIEKAECEMAIGLSRAFHGMRSSDEIGLRLISKAVVNLDTAIEKFDSCGILTKWCDATNNKAVALRFLGTRTNGAAGDQILRDAIAAYSSLVPIFEENTDEAGLARVRANLSSAQTELGRRDLPLDERLRLFEASEANGIEAANHYKSIDHVEYRSIALNNAGNAQTEYGFLLKGQAAVAQLFKAISTYTEANPDELKAKMPYSWALTQESVGLVYERLSEEDPGNSFKHLENAQVALKGALDIYLEDVDGFYADKCSESLFRVEKKLLDFP